MISIYKLTVEGRQECYVGSTKRDPAERLLEHARPGNRCASKALFRLGEVSLEILETCDPNSRDAREKFWILNTPGAINRCLPGDIMYRTKRTRGQRVAPGVPPVLPIPGPESPPRTSSPPSSSGAEDSPVPPLSARKPWEEGLCQIC